MAPPTVDSLARGHPRARLLRELPQRLGRRLERGVESQRGLVLGLRLLPVLTPLVDHAEPPVCGCQRRVVTARRRLQVRLPCFLRALQPLSRERPGFPELKERADLRRIRRDHRLEQLERLVVRAAVLIEQTEPVLPNVPIRLFLCCSEVRLLRFGDHLLPLVDAAELEITTERVSLTNLFGLLDRLGRAAAQETG